MKLINTTKGFDDAIKSVATRARKIDNDVQLIALSAIAHLDEHGDGVYVNRLFLALGKGARKTALANWFLAYGKVTPNMGEDKKERPFAVDKVKRTNMVDAAANPWFDFSPDKPVDEMFDVLAAINGILKRAGKAQGIKQPELVAKLRALVPEADEA